MKTHSIIRDKYINKKSDVLTSLKKITQRNNPYCELLQINTNIILNLLKQIR